MDTSDEDSADTTACICACFQSTLMCVLLLFLLFLPPNRWNYPLMTGYYSAARYTLIAEVSLLDARNNTLKTWSQATGVLDGTLSTYTLPSGVRWGS
jgi:hypothetical protein